MTNRALTPNEIRVLNAVYELQSSDVQGILDYFRDVKTWKYTTVQTFANNLVVKGRLNRTREGKKFVYEPILERAEFVADVINNLFGESLKRNSSPLVEYLLHTKRFKPDEAKQLRSFFSA